MANAVVGCDPSAISKMFRDYVESTDGKPRHTQKADYEVGLFDAFIAGAFSRNSKLQDALRVRMMDCAVEFEESGFIAGFRCALSLFQGVQGPAVPLPTIDPCVKEQTQHEPVRNSKADTKNAHSSSDGDRKSEKPKQRQVKTIHPISRL